MKVAEVPRPRVIERQVRTLPDEEDQRFGVSEREAWDEDYHQHQWGNAYGNAQYPRSDLWSERTRRHLDRQEHNQSKKGQRTVQGVVSSEERRAAHEYAGDEVLSYAGRLNQPNAEISSNEGDASAVIQKQLGTS